MDFNINDSSDAIRLEDLLYVAALPSLYRYMSIEKGVSLIDNYQLNVSSPLDFNDPYDCDPSLITISEDFILKTIKQNPFSKGFTSSPNFKNSHIFKKTVADFRRNKSKLIKNKILSRVGIACFTEKNDNKLMWAHYARNHAGICIEFSIEKLIDCFSQIALIEKSKSGFFLTIKYDTKKENYIYGGEDNNTSSLLLWLKTKSIDWEYEKEVRFIWPRWDGADITLPSSVIKNVYLGYKIKDEDEEKLKSLCKTNFPDASIYKMELSEEEYGLNAIKVL
jgi:hypothetical protein